MTEIAPDLSADTFRPRSSLTPSELSETYSVSRKHRGILLTPLPSGRVAIFDYQGGLLGIWDTPKEDFDIINAISDLHEAAIRRVEQLYHDALHGGEPSGAALARDLAASRREPKPRAIQVDLALDL